MMCPKLSLKRVQKCAWDGGGGVVAGWMQVVLAKWLNGLSKAFVVNAIATDSDPRLNGSCSDRRGGPCRGSRSLPVMVLGV